MTAYYNEIDPYAAQWLRNLIEAGHIAHGIVDDRSIEDVTPGDLRGFTQCHFFAGIAVWSHALRRAGWTDDRPVWTGSCPCQPFSAAGKGAGFTDERHLWPAFFHLIEKCRPAVVLGEQVASKGAEPWIDALQIDMEGMGYAVGVVPFPASSVGAPHIRDRLYWVADADGSAGRERGSVIRGRVDGGDAQSRPGLGGSGLSHGVADAADQRCERWRTGKTSDGRDAAWFQPERLCDVGGLDNSRQNHDAAQSQAACAGQSQAHRPADQFGGSSIPSCGLGITNGNGCEPGRTSTEAVGYGSSSDAAGGSGRMADAIMQQRPDGEPGLGDVDDASERHEGAATTAGLRSDMRPGPVNGFWRDADWLLCRDGKWRTVEPGTFPLAHGAPARVGRLRAYGNAINAEAARVFVEAVMESA